VIVGKPVEKSGVLMSSNKDYSRPLEFAFEIPPLSGSIFVSMWLC
jgi:hypothetical protein